MELYSIIGELKDAIFQKGRYFSTLNNIRRQESHHGIAFLLNEVYMYHLPHFKESDPKAVMDFVRQNPFAFIIGSTREGWPEATQVPLFLEEKEGNLFLTGHIMKQTGHHKAFCENDRVLCVFTGPHSYVSATWYTDPSQASTWNYISVHMKGRIRFLDESGLEDVLQKTSLHFENGEKTSPTVFDQLPEDYRNRLMKAIVAFEIVVEETDHVFKLSQNRDKESYSQIIHELSRQGGEAAKVADIMEERKGRVFPA